MSARVEILGRIAGRFVLMIVVLAALPVLIFVSESHDVFRMALSDLGPLSALVLVLVVNVAAVLQVLALVQCWKRLKSDLSRLESERGG